MNPFSFFSRSKKSVIGIDIGSSAIKLVQIRKEKGSPVLETYGSLAISSQVEGKEIGQFVNADKSVLSNVLSLLVKESNVTSKVAGVSIPFHSSLISLIDVPPLTDEKIAQAIPFEARKHIPVPIEDVSIDWFIIPEALLEKDNEPLFEEKDSKGLLEKEETRKVLLIAIHNNELLKYKEVLNKTDLQTKFFEIEIFSTLRSTVYENKSPILIIDIGARTTKFYVVENNIVLRSYLINQGGQNVTQAIADAEGTSFKEAEKMKRKFGFGIESRNATEAMGLVVNDIFTEANNAILDFEGRYHSTIGRVIMTGGGSSMNGIIEEGSKYISVGVELANPFSRLKYPAFLSETLVSIGPEFSVAVGAAIRALDS